MDEQSVKNVLLILKKIYQKSNSSWNKKSDPFQTLIATILSAQTTDAQVDVVTPKLFKRYPAPNDLAKADVKDVEKIIKSVGLYKNKTRNIIKTAKILVKDFSGKVPDTREKLMKLSGVGRKTANVVLIKAFGKNAMPVDTHVFRVSNRIGLANANTTQKTEEQLVKIIPQKYLGASHFWLILHGRKICKARKPLCRLCKVKVYCKHHERWNKKG